MFSINLWLMPMLLGWRIAIPMVIFGFTVLYYCHQYYNPAYSMNVYVESPAFAAIYSCVLIIATTILFIKPRQEYFEDLEIEIVDLDHDLVYLNKEVIDLEHEVTGLNEQVSHFHEKIAEKDQEITRLGATAQKILNNVINAIKFSQEGVVEIRLKKQDDLIIFTIQDQGVGIPPEEIHDIFTPFKMGSNTESKVEGRGVGLALCKSVIRAHNGDITVKSQPVGASFCMILPEE
jgi:signal transduction histidine kinase